MSRAFKVIRTELDRATILKWIVMASVGTRVTLQHSRRTLPQNSKMWGLLTDIADQVVWHGEKLNTGDWKDIFTASLRHARVIDGIDPGTKVALGLHTSDMDREELSALIDLIYAFGAEHGVVFQDTEKAAAA